MSLLKLWRFVSWLFAWAIAIAVILIIAHMPTIEAQEVKYCVDLETGEVIVVEAGMPCPFPMAEL